MVFIKPIKQIYKKIKDSDVIVLARHIGPDPDAIASTIALRDSIRKTWPQKKVYAVGKSVNRFKYYGQLDKPSEDIEKNALLIALDVPNISRIDVNDISVYKEIIKIDHHPYEDTMGSLEWVDTTASSACQLVAELIFSTKLKLDQQIAQNLFLGIVSDSDRFLLGYTSAKTFEIVTKLIKDTNMNFVPLYSLLYTRPIEEIRFHGYIAQNIQITENNLGYIIITPEILKEYQVDMATPSNMINDFNNIKDIIAWIFITYDDKTGIYKANIRSRGPIINKVASLYGGGGHSFACGVKTDSKQTVDILINALDEECKKYNETSQID